ncbi:MAG TPA: D-alanyl-D-alanine carboxypeptidase/D-alanyl-D-alanine-endopeptidase [Rhodanobacteraceae bacterium]
MKSTRILAAVVLLWASVAHAALPRAVARAFTEAGVPLNAVAVVVQDVSRPRPLFAAQPAKAMSPASVMKLVTTFAALDLLGPSYRWRTEAYADGPIVQGTLKGNLVLKGYGDPKITIEQWQSFMTALRANGLAAVDGDLALDRSRFALPAYDASAFDHEPRKPYNVGPDALLVNFKSVHLTFAPDTEAMRVVVRAEPPLSSVTVGALRAIPDEACSDWQQRAAPSIDDRGDRGVIVFGGAYPASCGERDWWVAMLDHPHYVRGMFETYFREAGGRFSGGVKEGVAPTNARPFAVLESPPLSEIVRDVNKLSNNVMARQIFLTLATTRDAAPATPARAGESIKRWLASRKLAMPGLVLENGSGLSRRERTSAGSLNRLLIAANASAVRDEFANSLAVAAVDGTVERRFHNDSVAGQALLKTGTLEGVRALAGYVNDASGRRFSVVAIVNDRNAARAGPALDFLVQWVYRNAGTFDPTLERN